MTAPNAVHDVELTLARYARLTRDAMQRYLGDRAPARYLYDLVREYPSRSGKGIRPALLLATCEAFGGSLAEGLGPAVAIEFAHNAFLVHDDIEDGSRQRRGSPTLHHLHGTPLAVNAGDALAVLALRPLRDGTPLSSRLSRRVSDEFFEMLTHTIEGQATELGWRADNVIDLGVSDYLGLIAQKTCWYTTVWPLRAGALIGSAGTAPLDALTRFGFHLGAAFQIRDDLLDLDRSTDRYGKDLLGDIREGKRTLMLIHLLGVASAEEKAAVVAFLAQAGWAATSPTDGSAHPDLDAETILDLMEHYGSVDFAFEFGQGIAAAAYESFHEAFVDVPPSAARDFIKALVPYMLARSA
ncbi:MAG: polyprenyl synthetase family protein [Pseudonocardiales bacterium]|nr:polyprenyl synthetase family protein [Pseudonocardiales bacterium]